MRVPVVRGVIDRRILINYRIEPGVLAGILPSPFRPQVVKGFGIAGICLIRLRSVRPRLVPSLLGIKSENAAHRIAVEWEQDGQRRVGVYIPRRDTSSRLNAALGGRWFPGVHHHARIDVAEHDGQYCVSIKSCDDATEVAVRARETEELPSGSIFTSLREISDFFEHGSLGYSPACTPGCYEGLELRSFNWHVTPLAVEEVRSSFFADTRLFPPGSVEFDSALLMRDIAHQWHARETIAAEEDSAAVV